MSETDIYTAVLTVVAGIVLVFWKGIASSYSD